MPENLSASDSPNRHEHIDAMATRLFIDGDLKQVINLYYREDIDWRHESPYTLLVIARALTRAGHYDCAQEAVEIILEKLPNFKEAHLLMLACQIALNTPQGLIERVVAISTSQNHL